MPHPPSAVLRCRSGMALVVTLLVVALLTALAAEFVYGVAAGTSFLDNWRASDDLMRSAKSGARLAAYLIGEKTEGKTYTEGGAVSIPAIDPYGDGTSAISILIEDEDAKFDLNTLVYQNGSIDEDAYDAFVRLLGALGKEDDIAYVADRVVDWIDPDSVPRAEGSEDGVRNGSMQGTAELALVPGVGREVYDRVVHYVSAHGQGLVNINGAEVPVIMSLSEEITKEMAERLITYRESTPFEAVSDITKVAGFETVGIGLQGKIVVKGSAFSVLSEAFSGDGLMAEVLCVMDGSGKISYWEER